MPIETSIPMPLKIWDFVSPKEVTQRVDHDVLYEQVYAVWMSWTDWPQFQETQFSGVKSAFPGRTRNHRQAAGSNVGSRFAAKSKPRRSP